MEERLRKVVLTGGPSSGKSTLIKELERRGHKILHEVARSVLEERRDIATTKDEWLVRQDLIYKRQLAEEEKASGLVFLDRGTIDIVAYSKHILGYVPLEVEKNNYFAVFPLERLPFVKDGLRAENGDEEAQRIHEKILETYSEFGYTLTFIPAFNEKTIEESVSKRADYLLSRLREMSL